MASFTTSSAQTKHAKFLLLWVLGLAFAACGDNSDSSSGPGTAGTSGAAGSGGAGATAGQGGSAAAGTGATAGNAGADGGTVDGSAGDAAVIPSATHYASPTGSATNSGLTKGDPWSLTHAAKTAAAGDVVYVQAGLYAGVNLVLSNSGTAGKPITFIGCDSSFNPIVSTTWSTYTYGDGASPSKTEATT